MSTTKTWNWHVDIGASAAAMGRFGRALVECGAGVSQPGPHSIVNPLCRGRQVLLVVALQDGMERRFLAICRPLRMTAPPRLSVGIGRPEDDGHPGRANSGWPCGFYPWRQMEVAPG
jgi:hypothetical protein